jgi:hypothetical protein
MLSASIPSKDVVPIVFKDKNFDLTNPHVFSAVTDFKDVIGSSSMDAGSINKELQEKLTHCSDTIEIYLLKEISKRSVSFFDALSHLKALQIEAQYCGDQIAKLRENIEALSRTTAKKGLEVVRIKRRRGNVAIIHGAVKLFSQLKQTQPLIQLLHTQSDYVGALDLIDTACAIINGHSKPEVPDKLETLCKGITLTHIHSITYKTFNFSHVKSIAGIKANVFSMQNDIEDKMKSEFVNLLSKDLKENVQGMIAEANELMSSKADKARQYANVPVMEWVAPANQGQKHHV